MGRSSSIQSDADKVNVVFNSIPTVGWTENRPPLGGELTRNETCTREEKPSTLRENTYGQREPARLSGGITREKELDPIVMFLMISDVVMLCKSRAGSSVPHRTVAVVFKLAEPYKTIRSEGFTLFPDADE
jgi:hypothetical protein